MISHNHRQPNPRQTPSFFDQETRTRASELGITHCLPKRDVDSLPAVIRTFTRS